MYLDMDLQIGQSRERFIAHLTLNPMLFGFVQRQLLFTGKYLVTVTTFVSGSIGVHISNVFFVFIGKSKRFVTEATLIWLPSGMQS